MNKNEAKATAEIVVSGLCEVAITWNSGGRYAVTIEQGGVYTSFSWDAPSANIRGAATEVLNAKCPGARPIEGLSFTSGGIRGTVTRGEAKHVLRAALAAFRSWERTALHFEPCRRERNDPVTARARAFLAA